MDLKSRYLLVYTIILYAAVSNSVSTEVNTTLSRDHVAVWFDYGVRYYDHEADNAYSKDDLAVMVDVVSKRFSTIVIDSAPLLDKLPPEANAHSRVWIPSVVAKQNSDNEHNSSYHTMRVIVTFDVAKIAITDQITSFDVAKYMADSANGIYSGSVLTLMMYTGYSIFSAYYNVKDTVQQLKVAKEKINATGNAYQLGIFMDLKDCGKFRGSLGEKAKEILPHVELVVTLLRPSYHQMSLDPEIVQKMFITKFEDCEKKMKEERPDITVIPSVVWLSRKESTSNMLQCWELMGNWAKKHDRYVIMYEAFDTPHGHLISDQGWWKLRDKAEHIITRSAFVEKIQVTSSRKSNSDGSFIAYNVDNSDEEGENSGASIGGPKLKIAIAPSANYQYPPSEHSNVLYIVLVLLTVICTLLVAVIAGLVHGFHTIVLRKHNNVFSHKNGNCVNQNRISFEDNASINGSVLEIRDTTPIVAVTYKK